jgi:Mg2+-importing ATPase
MSYPLLDQVMQLSNNAYWGLSDDSILEQTGSRLTGLTQSEAAERLARFGPNTVVEKKRTHLLARIVRRFAEPLVAILLVAAAISAASGDRASFALILAVISLSISIDIVQEYRAEIAADALKRSVAIHADVMRDSVLVSIPVEQVVPGDILRLRAGDLVPADGLVLRCRNLHVNEALMTGEPFPADKRPGPCAAATPADAFNALFAGTSVVSGEATMLAVVTGSRTQFGGIAAALATAAPPSALERGIHQLGLLILRLTSFLVLFVLLVQVAFGHSVLESFLFAVALAVGLTPELLPMIMTVTLSRGAIRMAQKRVIVKRLASIHDLGAMDVLCTDKTGTLTEARIRLVAHPGIDGKDSDRVLALAGINSKFETGVHSPLDEAIIQHCPQAFLEGWTKIDELPFDFERRCVSILAENDHDRCLVIKGAPESVLARASSVEKGGQTVPLGDPERAALRRIHDEQTALGHRMLAVAWRPLERRQTALTPESETNLIIAGFCVFVDPPKESAAVAIARLANQGVQIKVVSGDHEAVVRHVAETLKMPHRALLTGTEVDILTDSALAARVADVDLFARVTPDQKTRIIRALQARAHTVGFLGDGVNDAPAIRAAEVGLSVEGATDVARSAADMILLAQDLGVVADGVEEGRRTLANILKYVRMGTSSNFGNMLSMALASVVLPFLPMLPVQILLNNLLYDLSEIGIPFDNVDGEDLARPRAWNMQAILRFTLIMGTLSSLFDFAIFAILHYVFDVGVGLFRTAWFVESMATQILVIFIIRTAARAWSSKPNSWLVASSLGTLTVALLLPLTPLGAAFEFVHIPNHIALAVVVIVAAYLSSAELIKRFSQVV